MTLDINALLMQMIAVMPATLASVVTLIIALRTVAKVEEVHKATNSMKDALVAATRADALQEGHAQGVQDQKSTEAVKAVLLKEGHDKGVMEQKDKQRKESL